MRRGLLTLTQLEIAYCRELLPQVTTAAEELRIRLAAIPPQSPAEVSLELTEDSFESLLDALPTPQSSENPLVTTLREKVRTTLQRL